MQSIQSLLREVLLAGALDIRDVDEGKQEPFLYSSGNWGCGYVMIKGLVGRRKLIHALTDELSVKLAGVVGKSVDFIAGNATGGMIPGWLVSEALELGLRRSVPFVYIRGSRKKGGQKELITGIDKNPEIKEGTNGIVVEELVNFSQTTCNSSLLLREAGYEVTHAACILFYNNPRAVGLLSETKLEMIHLFTLADLLDAAVRERTHEPRLVAKYREFLADPLGWQAARGLKPVREGGTQ
jgi:orotate phosphoribosyltransferase